MAEPEDPDLYLAAALEREIERHLTGQYGELGSEYDQVEMDTLPFRDRTSPAFPTAFRFWDGWVDASNHDWHHYEPIRAEDWPNFARTIVASLREGAEPTDPTLMRYFRVPPPGFLRRLWHRHSSPAEGV